METGRKKMIYAGRLSIKLKKKRKEIGPFKQNNNEELVF